MNPRISNTKEGFENHEEESITINQEDDELKDTLNQYQKYEGTYFHLGKPKAEKYQMKTLNQCLNVCSSDKKCYGISRRTYDPANMKADCFAVYSLRNCQSSHQGSGEERTRSRNYNTYLKKSIKDHEHLCLSANNLNRDISLIGSNNLYWLLDEGKIGGYSSSYIEIDGLHPLAGFKIVDGLYGDGTVSFKPIQSKYPNHYLVHQYPRKEQIYAESVDSLKTEKDKARASFRVSRGLNGKGMSIRIIQFPEVYLRFENKKKKNDRLIAVPMENEKVLYDLATFYFHDRIHKGNTSGTVSDMEEGDNIRIITPQEKIRKAKTKNLHTLETQKALLENQNQKILDFDFSQANKVSYVGRELAHQASHIELGNYLKEQELMGTLEKKIKSEDKNENSIPNKENFNTLTEPFGVY